MQILYPPSVSGWPSYYQEPVYDLFWLNSSTFPKRHQLMNDYLRWGAWIDVNINGNWVNNRFNLIDYLKTYENPHDVDNFINELCFRFSGGAPSSLTKQRIRQGLLGDINEEHWTEELENILDSNAVDETSYDSISWRLGNAFEVIGLTGEFHLF
jgi:hypothetical protein